MEFLFINYSMWEISTITIPEQTFVAVPVIDVDLILPFSNISILYGLDSEDL